MKKLLLLSSLFSCMIFISCQEETSTAFDLSELHNSWVHSIEESESSHDLLYRPNDFIEFPPSRYRQFFSFDQNQTCVYSVIGPNDVHHNLQGFWNFEASTETLTIFDANNELKHSYKILALDQDVLRLVPL